jgi:hypothetical protein
MRTKNKKMLTKKQKNTFVLYMLTNWSGGPQKWQRNVDAIRHTHPFVADPSMDFGRKSSRMHYPADLLNPRTAVEPSEYVQNI